MAYSPHHAVHTPPHHSPSPRFWHAHLNHACTRAVSPLGGAGATDNMAGDQLAIWTRSTLEGPQGDPPQLRPVIPSQPHLSSVLTASQPFNLNLPLIFPENEDLIMDNARQAAAAGFIRPESIPLLALTDESFTIVNSVGLYVFPSRRQTPLALFAHSPPQSHSDKVPIVPRH